MIITIAVDVETTGVEPGSRMLELAAIAFDESGAVTDQYVHLVNPGMPIPPDVTKVNGITDDMVKDAPTAEKVLNGFFGWLPGKLFVGHYAQYDTGIISWEAGRCGIPIPDDLQVLCTCAMAKENNITKNNKLITIADYYQLKRIGDDHRALSDAYLCKQYFLIVKSAMEHEAAAMNSVFKSLAPLPWGAAGHNYQYVDPPEPVANLPELVAAGTPLSFKYKDAKDEVTERTITPYGWALADDADTLHGWCHMREARRTFRVDRIVEVMADARIDVTQL